MSRPTLPISTPFTHSLPTGLAPSHHVLEKYPVGQSYNGYLGDWYAYRSHIPIQLLKAAELRD